MKKLNIFLIFILGILTITSCSKDKEVSDNDEINIKKITIDTHKLTQWQYFAVNTDGEIEFVGEDTFPTDTDPLHETGKDAEWKQRSDWDFALNRMNIRTNSGESGLASGGLVKTSTKDFEDVETENLNSLKYEVDKIGKLNMVLSIDNMPPPRASVSMSPVFILNKLGGMPPLYNKINKVFVLKTAKSEYLMFKIVNYYNKEGEGGNMKIKYHLVK